MSVTMKEKSAVTCQLAIEYKRATKKQKREILDTLMSMKQWIGLVSSPLPRHAGSQGPLCEACNSDRNQA